jgi:hypothetical protein
MMGAKQFIRKHRSTIILFVYLVLLVVGQYTDIVAKFLFATLIATLVCTGIMAKWNITYTKGRRPPIEIAATLRKGSQEK